MLTLAINTAGTHESVAIILGKKVLSEVAWVSNRDESEKLIGAISKILKKAKKDFSDIKKIIIVTGPGPFSSVRIGVTVANTLGLLVKAQVFEIDTCSMLKLRLKNKKSVIMLHAGGIFAAVKGFGKTEGIFTIQEITDLMKKGKKSNPLEIFCDLTENELRELKALKEKNWTLLYEKNLGGFGKTVAQTPEKEFKKTCIATPVYLRPPQITHARSKCAK